MERKGRDYFVFPHPFWIVVILFKIWLLMTTTFAPDRIPWYLGSLGEFAKHFGKNYHPLCVGWCVVALTIHAMETAYAVKLCIDKKMNQGASVKWTLQTVVFGFASLMRLAPYSPDKKLP